MHRYFAIVSISLAMITSCNTNNEATSEVLEASTSQLARSVGGGSGSSIAFDIALAAKSSKRVAIVKIISTAQAPPLEWKTTPDDSQTFLSPRITISTLVTKMLKGNNAENATIVANVAGCPIVKETNKIVDSNNSSGLCTPTEETIGRAEIGAEFVVFLSTINNVEVLTDAMVINENKAFYPNTFPQKSETVNEVIDKIQTAIQE